MDESFRRSYRRLTGKSLLGFSGTPNRSRVINFLAEKMHTAYAIALKEHLDQADEEQGSGEYELISEAPKTQIECHEMFKMIRQEIEDDFKTFRAKWAQRYSVPNLLPKLRTNGRIISVDGEGYQLDVGKTKKEVNDFYYESIYYMVGDAEKLFVNLNSRIIRQQNRLTDLWYKESIDTPISKILPTIEAGLRECEIAVFKDIRFASAELAKEYFAIGFKKRKDSTSFKIWKTEEMVIKNIGEVWNPSGVWDNGFRAFLEDYTDYVRGICLELLDWYQTKLFLYLRGFSKGQLDLFASQKNS